MKNELTHHGILGMKWGKRNGPPYPIEDYSKYSAEEKAQLKAKAIREGNVKEAQANRSEFDDNELRQLLNRYDLNTKLSQINQKDVKSGEEKFDKMVRGLEKTAKLTETGTRAYNAFAKIANAFGEDLPIVGEKKEDKKRGNIADRKSKKQLEDIINNPQKYSAEDYQNAKNAYQNVVDAQNKAKSKTEFKMEDLISAANNSDNYSKKDLDDIYNRYQTIEKIKKATLAEQYKAEEEATKYVEAYNEMSKASSNRISDHPKWRKK